MRFLKVQATKSHYKEDSTDYFGNPDTQRTRRHTGQDPSP